MIVFSAAEESTSITLNVSKSDAQLTLMPLTIIVLDSANAELSTIASIIKKDLQFTEQFTVTIQKYDASLSKKDLKKIIKQLCLTGTPLTVCINIASEKQIEWRLYETMQAKMLAGKKYTKKGACLRGWAHNLADEIWKTLTNNDGFFSSRIAYCKNVIDCTGQTNSKLCISDFDGSSEQILIDASTVIIAPRWHINEPKLFYSEYADTNVRLMSVSMKKKKETVASFDGINMLANWSPDGESFVYCSSRGEGSGQLYHQKKNGLKRFTRNSGNNTCPIFIDKDRICFCSNFQTGNPQIYIGNMQTGHLQRITKSGYCTSPAYCPKTNKLAYHMMMMGTMQIWIYDLNTKEHTQVTRSNGNKHETCWSSDGTHLLFDHENILTYLNLLTGKITQLTAKQDQCSYPHLSHRYARFPVVT
jgi:tol-pal system beta propeller repeat protein TolB